MLMLIAGVLLWTVAHLFKRIAPEPRAKMGNAGKGIVAVALVASVVLMTLGYQSAPLQFFWGRNPMMVGINNLLVLLAFYLFAASVTRSRITGVIRHPQLTAMKAWAVGHLLVNGDTASFVLFGGLLAWAVASVIIIGKQDGKPPLSVQSSAPKEIITVVAALIAFGGAAYVHKMLGYPVFG